MQKHPAKCTCGRCLNDPTTTVGKKLEKAQKKWQKRTAPLTDAIQRSQRLTAADYSLRINT